MVKPLFDSKNPEHRKERRKLLSIIIAFLVFFFFALAIKSDKKLMPDLMDFVAGSDAGTNFICFIIVSVGLIILRVKLPLFLYTSEILWGWGFMMGSYDKYAKPAFQPGLFCAGLSILIIGLRDCEFGVRDRMEKVAKMENR